MAKESFPRNFWTVNGQALPSLRVIFLLMWKFFPNVTFHELQSNPAISQTIADHLLKMDSQKWGLRSRGGVTSAIKQQLAWGLTNQTKIQSGQAAIYSLNQRIAQETKKEAKYL
jgi:hypothetical protein